MAFLEAEGSRAASTRVAAFLAGFDFPLGYPVGTARKLAGSGRPFLHSGPSCRTRSKTPRTTPNNRFEVANAIKRRVAGHRPFLGPPGASRPARVADPRACAPRGIGFAEHRACETLTPAAQPCWKLFTTGSVVPKPSWAFRASPSPPRPLRGRLRGLALRDTTTAPSYSQRSTPRFWPPRWRQPPGRAILPDEVQVRLLSRALARMDAEGTLDAAFNAAKGSQVAEEGWISWGRRGRSSTCWPAPALPPR